MDWNRTLLIVDDEPTTLEGYREYLAGPAQQVPIRKTSRAAPLTEPSSATTRGTESFHLILASSGPEALQKAKEHLASGGFIAGGFFDVKLEGSMDGIEVLRTLWKEDSRMHACIVTAFHDRSVDELETLFGAAFSHQWDYINKPFTKSEIIQKARQMIAAWNAKVTLEQTQKQLIQSEKLAAIGQIARGVGHEFGNILLRIMGKADLGAREASLEKAHEHFKVIVQASERASVIVRNLQSFARESPKPVTFQLSDIVQESISLIRHELTKGSITLENKLEASSIPPLHADRGALSQVILNLLINSMQALEASATKTIEISATQAPSKGVPGILVAIADSGPGISAEILPRVFDTAFSTKGMKGSGLGLSISKSIINQHSGTIEALPKGKLGGAEFRFWIPLTPGKR